jgi:hypothetical protein
VYFLPTLIGIIRQVEGLGWLIAFNVAPAENLIHAGRAVVRMEPTLYAIAVGGALV